MRFINLIVGISIMLVVTSVFGQSYSAFKSVKQPNGVTLEVKESGYCCTVLWDETPDGYVITLGKDGYHHYTTFPCSPHVQAAAQSKKITSSKFYPPIKKF